MELKSNARRIAYFVSDGTGITAENIGHSLLTQFANQEFEELSLPYVDDLDKAKRAVEIINNRPEGYGRPIVLSTIVNDEIRSIIATSNAFMLDSFGAFLGPLEKELHQESDHEAGRSHNIADNDNYTDRIDAVHYALDNDDGARVKDYHNADLILVGVSRCGKTPSCLYLALQYGIRAANYPITDDDADEFRLPKSLRPFSNKIFGLTIDAERLASIREHRRPNSRYASLRQCVDEVERVEAIFRREGIKYLNTTHHSVEEISTKILAERGLKRKML